jgi:Uma2 family endonuclease
MARISQLLSEQPAIEFLDGRPHRKVSSKRTHGIVQFAMARLLYAAAQGSGEVVTEWHVYPGRDDGEHTVLVPDVAFVSRGRMRELSSQDREEPPFSPDVVVEVWSPNNDRAYLNAKIAKYLRTGAILVLDVDPYARTIAAHDLHRVHRYGTGDVFEHDAAPWLRFGVAGAFSDLDTIG